MRLPVWILAAALLCGAAVVSDASAGAGDASFALKPVLYDPALAATKSYFVLAVKPGAVVHDRIRLVNTGGRTGTAYLYPVDATTGQTSGAVYLSRQSPRRDVGAWISLSRSRVTLAPGANAIVDFTIRVPRTARPGDHLGAVVAENSQVQRSTGHGALQIRIRHLTIDAVEVELPGTPVARVVPTGVKAGGQHGYQYVYVHLKSTGTVLVRPNASVVIRNAGGRVVARRSFQLDTFVPHTADRLPGAAPETGAPAGSVHGRRAPVLEREPCARLSQDAARAVRRHAPVPVRGELGRADAGVLGRRAGRESRRPARPPGTRRPPASCSSGSWSCWRCSWP